jgi:hypothetical protein
MPPPSIGSAHCEKTTAVIPQTYELTDVAEAGREAL